MTVNQLVNDAVRAYQRNDKQEARRLFAEAERIAVTRADFESIKNSKIYCRMD